MASSLLYNNAPAFYQARWMVKVTHTRLKHVTLNHDNMNFW